MNRRWLIYLALLLCSVGLSLGCARSLSSQPTAPAGLIAFPSDYSKRFTHYATVDCPNSRVVRQMYANPEAIAAAKAGETLPSGAVITMETYAAQPDANGRLVKGQLNHIWVREKRTGWGSEAAEDRNGEWQYASFSPSSEPGRVASSATSCLGCHQQASAQDFVFTLPDLIAAAQTGELQRHETKYGLAVCR